MEAKTLIAQIERARQSHVDIDHIRIVFRRPPETEFAQYVVRRGDGNFMRVGVDGVIKCVVGWENVKECDLVESGSDDLVPFDSDLFAIVLADNLKWVNVISDAILGAVSRHRLSLSEAEKN